MATFNKFNCFPEHLAEKVHNLASDTLKVALTNVAPTAAMVALSEITQISASGGYASGGAQSTQVSSGLVSNIYRLMLTDTVFTATAGLGPFRYVVLYNDTPTTPVADPLIGWWDYGSSITLAVGETFTVDYDPTTGAIALT